MEEKVQAGDRSPSARDAIHIPANFVGKIAGPDDQVLREGHIDVQHDEGKQKLAEVMLLGDAKDGIDWLVL